jgi:hypothetical protein
MRTLIVKQTGDPFGPWSPVVYGREAPGSILSKFCYKPTMWEMTCRLRADWSIVPSHGSGVFNRYVAQFDGLARLLAAHQTGVVAADSIDFSRYDVVISTEACLPEAVTARFPRTLFAYFMNEHDNGEYNEQKHAPATAYDRFLDHMCGVTGGDAGLSIPFPYLRAREVVRCLFPRRPVAGGPPRIWIDARSLAQGALGDATALWTPTCDEFARALAAEHGVDVRYRANIYRRYYDVPDPSTRDAWQYYAAMGQADYFIGLAAAGAGQALCDAASLGLACVGTPALVYHRLICVPEALCADLGSAIGRVKDWHRSRSRHASVTTSQDEALDLHMAQAPLRRLGFARALKLAAAPSPVSSEP